MLRDFFHVFSCFFQKNRRFVSLKIFKMTVLTKIRSRAGLLIGVIGLALASFVIGDIFTTGRSFFGSNNNVLAEVAGKEISINEFDYMVQSDIEKQKKNNPDMTIDDFTKDMMVQQTWNQLVNEIIMKKEYEHLGITVSDDELYEVMVANPHPAIVRQLVDPKTGKAGPRFADPVTGQLSPAKLMEFTQTMSPEDEKAWAQLEGYMRELRTVEKYNQLIKTSLYVTSAEAKRIHAEENKVFRIRYVGKKYNAVADSSVKVTDSDLKNYYNNHLSEYKVGENSRKIEYVSFDAFATAEDSAAIREDLEKLAEEFKTIKSKEDSSFIVRESDNRIYDNNYVKKGSLSIDIDSVMFSAVKGTVIGPYIENNSYKISKLIDVKFIPDSVKARHILVKIANGDTARAKAKVDSLKKIVNSKNFAAIATAVSEDFSSAEKGGDLGWFPQGQMVRPFNDSCFNGKKGAMPIVFSQFGYHLIEILDKSPEIKQVKVGTVERKIVPSSKTLQAVYLKASGFAGKKNTPELFEKAAETMGKRIADNIKENDKTIAGIESPRELIRWMYKEDVKKGAISPALEFNNKFVVAHLAEIREKGIAPLEEVKEEVEAGAIREKKAEKLASEFSAWMQGASTIDVVATKAGESVQNIEAFTFSKPSVMGIGRDGDLIGTAYTLKQGTISKPIKGKTGVYVVFVDQVRDEPALTDYSGIKGKMLNAFQSDIEGEAMFEALKETAGVVDNRAKFY